MHGKNKNIMNLTIMPIQSESNGGGQKAQSATTATE